MAPEPSPSTTATTVATKGTGKPAGVTAAAPRKARNVTVTGTTVCMSRLIFGVIIYTQSRVCWSQAALSTSW